MGVRITSAPSERNTSSKLAVYFESRSRIKNRKEAWSSATSQDRFLACCVTQADSGLAVTPARRTLLVPSSMKKRAYSVFRNRVSTVKKSHARIPVAWARRNSETRAVHVPVTYRTLGDLRNREARRGEAGCEAYRGLSQHQRLVTAPARAFLGQLVTLP